MKTCEHQDSECDCQKCDSFTCFEKRQKSASCDCPDCKNSQTCILYPKKDKPSKHAPTCELVSKGCNTIEVWQKTDKYHLGRDVICSNCESNKQSRRSNKDLCNHGKDFGCNDEASLKSDDKLCSQCEFKRNVLKCLNDGSMIKGLNSSIDSSQDKVLCSKCEQKRNNSASCNDAGPDGGHVCSESFEEADTNGHTCKKHNETNTDTIPKNDSDLNKEKMCNKCKMKDVQQKFKKFSFDEGKVYEFPEKDQEPKKEEDSQGKGNICSKCFMKDASMQKFKKFSFDDGKVYEFPEGTNDPNKDKECHGHSKMCTKCLLKKNVLHKIKKLSYDNGKVYEFEEERKSSYNRPHDDKICSKCQLKKASQEKSKNVCDLHKDKNTDLPKKESKQTKICTKCGRNKSEPISMKIIYTDKSGNDIICNKIIKTITKTEKDKIYKFKDDHGTKIEKKISSKEFKKSFEKHFGKATQVNNLISPPPPPTNKDTRRHLSAQVMNVPSAKVSYLKPSSSATQANKSKAAIPKFDIFKRIKQIYDSCKCKDCQCIASNDLSCNSHSIKGKTDSKYAQNLQFWEGFRAALNNLLHEKPTCTCKPCECIVCNDGKAKSCSCKSCHCIECASVLKNQPKQNTIVVASVGENAPESSCACAPCDCIRCRTNVVSMSSNATHEISTGRARHQNCRCSNCVNDDCVPDETDLCKCKKQGEAIKKPTTKAETNYDIRTVQVEYDRFNQNQDIKNEAMTMFVKVPKTYPFQNNSALQNLVNESDCSCRLGKAGTMDQIKCIELDNNSSDSCCSCITCNCEACSERVCTLSDDGSSRCACDSCECVACKGLDENAEGLCPLKIIRLEINDDVSCDCDFCQKTSINEIRSQYEFLKTSLPLNPSYTETMTSRKSHSTKSTECQILDSTSSVISMYLPATVAKDQDKEKSHKSNQSYEISTDNKDLEIYKISFYKELFEADQYVNLQNNQASKACEDNCNGDCLTVLETKGDSTVTIVQNTKEDLKPTDTTSKASVAIKSIVQRIKSLTNAEKLLNIAKAFSADLIEILHKYEEANRELSEKSHNYVTSMFEEKKEQFISKVNEYNFLSGEKKGNKIDTNPGRDIWVIDGYCSNNGNVVYIPIKCNDDNNNENNDLTDNNKKTTGVNFVTTQDAVHINLRLKKSAKERNKKKAITAAEMDKLSNLQSEFNKSKTTKMDLETLDVNNPTIYGSVESESFKSYKYSKGDSDTKDLEQSISFNNDFKVGAIEVQRVSTCSIIIKWSSPKVDENVLGYELLIDGRPAQKILNPTRCMALVSSLPRTDKVLLTVRTLLVTSSPIKYYPTTNSVYYPILTKCQSLSANYL